MNKNQKLRENSMKHPVIQERIHQLIRERICSGTYPPGSKLPMERDFATQLGIGRNTLRKVLEQLEQEGLVERRERLGTYVKQDADAKPVIYYLLPCANMALQDNFISAFNHRRNLDLLMQLSATHNFSLVTIPLTLSNRIQDIDQKQLSLLPPGSRILICALPWYDRLMPFLKREQFRIDGIVNGITAYCKYSTCALENASYDLSLTTVLRWFVKQGVRHPCFILPETTLWADRLALAMQEVGMDYSPDSLLLCSPSAQATLPSRLSQLRQRYPVDALFFNVTSYTYSRTGDLKQDLGLPPGLPVILRRSNSLLTSLTHGYHYLDFDYQSIIQHAVTWLLSKDPPVQRLYHEQVFSCLEPACDPYF